MGQSACKCEETNKEKQAPDLSKLDEILSANGGEPGALIPVLQQVQTYYGYIPQGAVYRISETLKIYPSRIYGVMTFYTQFKLEPKGKNVVMVCTGTACHVKGSERVAHRVKDELRLGDGKDTTEDGLFTMEQVACVGACSIAPVVVIGKKIHGKMTPDKTVRELKKISKAEDG